MYLICTDSYIRVPEVLSISNNTETCAFIAIIDVTYMHNYEASKHV